MDERTLMQAILDAARLCGWRCYHVFDSRRSAPGFPDIVALHPRAGRILVMECKSDRGIVRQEQYEWLGAFGACGAEVAIVRPEDLDGILDTIREAQTT